jgi:uncharacterized membrane protein
MKLRWRTEILSWLCLSAMFLLAAWAWQRVPDRIPVHWNAAGEVDGYGGRFMGLLLLPLIAAGLYPLFLVLPRLDPGQQNYEGFAKVYSIIRNTLMGFLCVLHGATTLAALGHRIDMSRVISLAMGVLFVVLGNYLGKIRPNWFVGVRTPWTLSSKLSWSKTHRLAGWLFMGTGLATLGTGLWRPQWGIYVMLGTMLPSVIAITVYSYFIWRDDPERLQPAGTSAVQEL